MILITLPINDSFTSDYVISIICIYKRLERYVYKCSRTESHMYVSRIFGNNYLEVSSPHRFVDFLISSTDQHFQQFFPAHIIPRSALVSEIFMKIFLRCNLDTRWMSLRFGLDLSTDIITCTHYMPGSRWIYISQVSICERQIRKKCDCS